MDYLTMMLLAKGAQRIGQSGARLLQPKFANTTYGRQLSKMRTEGALSPGAEKNILNRVGTQAGRSANVATNRMIGSAVNSGMGSDSVAIRRGIAEAELDKRRIVTDTAKDIYLDEEKAKKQAKIDYAKSVDQDKRERRNAMIGVASSVAQTAGDYYGNKVAEGKAQDQSYMDAVAKYGENIRAVKLPGGETRYTGGIDSKTGKVALTQDDQRAIEVYAQKANIKNSATVSQTFEDFLNDKNADPDKFIEKMKDLGLEDADIVEIIKMLSK